MNRLIVTAPFSKSTGFGNDAAQRIKALIDSGYECVLRPTISSADAQDWVKHRISKDLPTEPNELFIGPPTVLPTPGKNVCSYVTLESTELDAFPLKMLRRADSILVPCHWNKRSLLELGLTQPIHVVPQGIDPEVFKPRLKPDRDVFLFGCAGNSARGSAGRKGLETVIEAFRLAFPKDPKAVLMVKDHPGSSLTCFDRRVEIVREAWEQERMAEWYASLDVFVSASRGEAWGRCLHEAMASGVPCIAPRYGGHADFFDYDAGWTIDFKEVQAAYGWVGKWCDPSIDSLVSGMAHLRDDLELRIKRGKQAREMSLKFTLEKVNRIFIDTLIDLGLLPVIPKDLV